MIEAINGAIRVGLEMAMHDIVNDMVRNCPVDSGFTWTTIRGEVQGNVIILYAGGAMEYIEFGTIPHIIKPKNKKVLAFAKFGAQRVMRKGKVKSKFTFAGKSTIDEAVFAKIVHHPGTTPNPVMRNAIHRGITAYIPNRIKQALEGITG